jgi:cytochrome o ubiquinol oxidase subunit 2
LVGGCSGGILDPIGPVGKGDAQILLDTALIMAAIVVPTMLLTAWVAWRYRASNTKAKYLPEWAYSGRIEAVTWSIPILTIMLICGVVWIGSHKLDPFKPLPSNTPPVEVQVVSLDWKWLFIYPKQGVATVNQLVVPAGAPVHFNLTSASVLNVFFVPQLGSMIYTMPGMVSQVWLQADRPAVLYGFSAHFSGDGFSDMNFQVHSVPQANFDAWAQGVRGASGALDRGAYANLAEQSRNVKPFAYGSVDPGLFQAIASQQIPPAPGPGVLPVAPGRPASSNPRP